MNFNSPIFLLFISVVILVNYFLSKKYRPAFLLLTSLFFISYYNVNSLIVIVVLSIFNFYLANKIINNRFLFIGGVIINSFAILFFNFLSASHEGVGYYLLDNDIKIESVIVIVGVSFYSLQNIAYLTDIYFKRIVPENSFSNYLLSVSFFTKIISGPVVLVNDFIPQILSNTINPKRLVSGFNRFLIGLFKKMVIADQLSPAIHSVFDYDDNYAGLTTLVAIYLFTIQLYFDFSGYTDMALGISKMLGYDLKENFNLPFRSTSISEFWRRWHMSLMNWLTTYLYYPLVYHLRKLKKNAVFIGVILIFFTSSIWRGISIPFFAWAICHIVYIIFELLTKRYRSKLSTYIPVGIVKLLGAFVVFNAISFSNIFFRASSIEEAGRLINNTVTNFLPSDWLTDFVAPLAIGGHQIEQFNLIISLFVPIVFLLFERKINTYSVDSKFNASFVFVCVLMIMVFGVFSGGAHFVYMQY